MALFTSDEPTGWLRLVTPGISARMGHVRHVLFDFDGTLSVLRQGWEEVMVPLMVEAICPNRLPAPEIEAEVRAYVDRSTGILTIRQMEWMVDAVQRYNPAETPKSAADYKKIYLARLELRIHDRRQAVEGGIEAPETCMVAGALDFVRILAGRGVRLYLASGSDHGDVAREAAVLGLEPYFEGGIFGALDDEESHAKERVIQAILDDHHLSGSQLLVVGDGPVEIREAVSRQAIALGVASDELARSGWNPRKIDRLISAGADLMVADFSRAGRLAELLSGS
jgi:phosphoglycolate phosphatase-like HAD superfamily hydrolase